MGKELLIRLKRRLDRFTHDQNLYLSLVSLGVGAIAAFGAVIFRESIVVIQILFEDLSQIKFPSLFDSYLTWFVVLPPVVGGLLVGILIKNFTKNDRASGVAEVIEASAISGGKMPLKEGLISALASALSIGCGASVGREGPAVQLGATLASSLGSFFKLDRTQCRILLGAGAASAVAASFNAPFAGVFFAHEVIIGHYALTAFAPVAVAAIIGTVISRLYFGDFPAFTLAGHEIESFFELPAFAVLGVACAVASIILIRLVPITQNIYRHFRIPRWSAPIFGGLILGLFAMWCPEIMGVGYEATNKALNEDYGLGVLLTLLIMKLIATIVSLGSGFVGGVFSPSLFMGAMLGGAFGIIVSWPFPDLASSIGSYSITGMGAMAAAVLGAPISTTIMIFELTGDYRLTLSVLVAVVISTLMTKSLHGPSYFLWVLAHRGVVLQGGHEVGALEQPELNTLIRHDHSILNESDSLSSLRDTLVLAANGEVFVEGRGKFFGRLMLSDMGKMAYNEEYDMQKTVIDLVKVTDLFVYETDTLDDAVQVFSGGEDSLVAVLDAPDTKRIVGCLHERDVIRAQLAYVRRLERLREDEH
tara:strand:+ start:2644 stop:4413 length:1770 start_codon:yes stop_codon:yes gene_type:complete